MKLSKTATSLLASTAVLAGVFLAQGKSNNVHASTVIGQIQASYVSNLRANAGTNNRVTGSIRQGSVYNYTATAQASGYTWYRLGVNSWVASAGVAPKGSAPAAPSTPAAPATGSKVIGQVRINYLSNLRSNGGTSYGVTGSVKAGAIYNYTTTVQANGYTWYRLGVNSWVASAGASVYNGSTATAPSTPAASNTNASSKAAAVIALAKAQLGKPYVWGGKGPSSFDCSGLMYYVFLNAAGKNIGGYTVAQESAGTRISLSSLRAGDLVFWGSAGATYHVGLYIGNNQFIDAPQPGQTVRISTINSYFMPSFGLRVL
ncbi:C40 family peptidase [Lacticaseibacillus baoqingensis]|uniref:C40 family peptidase n=1 Tax=Lacticaseibacillus baoqingensis TaxID=2486013 RepID=A0ABW4E6F6_9LACO|nr:C40 family peptidase [Lacticaseibacillus baoqingensis]